MPAPIPYGDETLVNTTTTNAQKAPQVTALANGTYVVVWQDSSTAAPDNSPDSVRAQIFHADGTRLGSEFVLSEFPFAVQQDPVVTALPDGRFVAAWESFNHALQDQSGSHISARIFNPDGTPSTGEFQVNTHTDFWQTKPAIATLDTGGFVITWMHDFVGGNVNYDIFARVYGANGQPVSAEDRGVDISTGVIERAPVVTGLPGGKFVIAWEDSGSATQTDGSGSHIRAMIYTGTNFQPLDGPSFVVNSTVANNQSDPAIATLSNGNFVLSWTHVYSASDDDVRGRVFNGHGTAQSPDFGVDTSGSGVRETQSAIAALPNGEYFVVWRDSGGAAAGQTDGSGSHIRGAIMSANGTPVSGQFIINTTANGSQGEPALTRLADGRFVVVWTDSGMNAGDTSGSAIRSQIVDPRTAAVTLADSGGADEWVGTAFADTMNGGVGGDILQGAGGGDTLIGGDGNDEYHVDDANDVVVETLGGGTSDRVVASIDYSLAAEVEQLVTDDAAGTAAIDLTGNALANLLIGNAGDNRLNGKGSADTMIGGDGDDRYYVDDANDAAVELAGGGTADRVVASVDYTLSSEVEELVTNNTAGTAAIDLFGNALANLLIGNDGDNILDGKGGADTMNGYGGNDTYFVDAESEVVVEVSGGGTADRVVTSVSYILSAEVEELVADNAAGTAPIDLAGNALANLLIGNDGNNILDGKGGPDTMIGGGGNDRYYVDDANDVVTEVSGGGTADRVVTSIDYTLSSEVEELVTDNTAGTAAIDLFGNALVNRLVGNAGDNVLNGKGGADEMRGGAGSDRYHVNDANDVVIEKAGGGTADRVITTIDYTLSAEVEELATNSTAGTAAIDLTGSALANLLLGNAGDNILNGKGGADTMRGYGGNDGFVFDSALGASNIDTIDDFSAASDTIHLSDEIFAAITGGTGMLSPDQFVANASGAAQNANHHVIYETDTGKLFYDSNGNSAGGSTQFATLDPGLSLSNANFLIV